MLKKIETKKYIVANKKVQRINRNGVITLSSRSCVTVNPKRKAGDSIKIHMVYEKEEMLDDNEIDLAINTLKHMVTCGE